MLVGIMHRSLLKLLGRCTLELSNTLLYFWLWQRISNSCPISFSSWSPFTKLLSCITKLFSCFRLLCCAQWRSQTKIILGEIFEGPKCLRLGDQQYLRLGPRFWKHKMTRCAKNLGENGPLDPLPTPMVGPIFETFDLYKGEYALLATKAN